MTRAVYPAHTSAFTRLDKPHVAAAIGPLIAERKTALYAPVAFELSFSARSAAGDTTSYAYDAAGRVTTTTDGVGAVTTRTYTVRGETATVSNALGETVTSTWDPAGNLATVTDATLATEAGSAGAGAVWNTFAASAALIPPVACSSGSLESSGYRLFSWRRVATSGERGRGG